MSITFEGLDTFSNTLAEFGVTYKKSSELFFSFLDTLTFYNITNTTSTYDIQNTKFYNFMYNMKLDNIKFDQYKEFEYAMFTAFTATTPLRNYIPYEHEKPILDSQLRDIIIRKDSLLFGVDKTINGQYSNEPVNGALVLDTTFNVTTLYADITQNGTIMPLVSTEIDGNIEDPTKTPEKIYSHILKNIDNVIKENMRLISQILTPYEYEKMKTNPGQLHARSVMSRLCLILKQNKMKDRYQSTLFIDSLLNLVRTFPFLTFRKIYESFRGTGTTYSEDNSTRNEGNVYTTIPPPVKEGFEGFATLTTGEESYGNYQSVFSSNTAFPFVKISDTKLYDSYDLSKTSFMKHSNVM
jgi:hypothetical protein